MIIDTKYLGTVDVDDKKIIGFEEGLLGFEDLKRYAVLDMGENTIFKCLQSVDCRDVAFVIINPWDAIFDYEIDVDDRDISSIGEKDYSSLAVYTILTIKPESITANLIGPVIINTKTMRGKQVVLANSQYTTRYSIINPGKKG